MASFRTGFKIFGEISLKQGLGRIRSFSEDRKPRQWLPEDQWAVRQPGSTCPDPNAKPPKPAKPSRSWLSVCKEPPEPPIECEIRHNNCPPPPVKVKEDGPWFSLDNFIPKKKPEKPPPPLTSCREEMKRRELFGEEEKVCEKMAPTLILDIKPDPEPGEICPPKQPPCPAPVVTLSVPLPKDLDLMLWCGRPSKEKRRIAVQCQTDKLPYQEFRPQKPWKPPPFSLPCKIDPAPSNRSFCVTGSVPFSEFKQIDLPKPLYTRYKSVDLRGSSSALCMVEIKCPDNEAVQSLAITPPPCPSLIPPSKPDEKPCMLKKTDEICTEKPFIQVGSCKPVRIKKATKCKFRPKPTKLIEKRVPKNPCADHKKCNLKFRTQKNEENECIPTKLTSDCEPPKVITGTLTDEPQIYERNISAINEPPKWMFCLSKPGSKETPLVPACTGLPKEPDWCSETDGLKFYDGDDLAISPKPPPDPCKEIASIRKSLESGSINKIDSFTIAKEMKLTSISTDFKNRFVLMPKKYGIKKRPEDPRAREKESSSFEKFIEAKTSSATKNLNLHQMKENILYDLQRLCPKMPFCPSKVNIPCRKPPDSESPQNFRFYRRFSTLTSSALKHKYPVSVISILRRMECGDSAGKCKVTKLIPKDRECPEKKKPPECAEIALPCCPKPRIPPSCDVRKTMPLCKKKLAPKPSFSECSRPPLPCPKITECDCWERKPKSDKNGRK